MRTIHFDILAPVYDKIIKAKKPRALLKSIDRYLKDNGQYRILEIGGGTGRFAQFFTGMHELDEEDVQCRLERVENEVIIIDPSKRMLRKAEKKNIATLVEGYAEELPFEDNSMDLVIATDSLHHWKCHQKALGEITRVLKPGGVVAIEEINPRTLIGKFVILFERVSLMGSSFFRPKQLGAMLDKADLEVREITEFKGPAYHLIAQKGEP